MTSASDQKLFCEVCSAFNCSFDEFVGEKWSPRPIPPPSWLLPGVFLIEVFFLFVLFCFELHELFVDFGD